MLYPTSFEIRQNSKSERERESFQANLCYSHFCNILRMKRAILVILYCEEIHLLQNADQLVIDWISIRGICRLLINLLPGNSYGRGKLAWMLIIIKWFCWEISVERNETCMPRRRHLFPQQELSYRSHAKRKFNPYYFRCLPYRVMCFCLTLSRLW